MVPIDEETVEFVDRILTHRSAGRPLRYPRTQAVTPPWPPAAGYPQDEPGLAD
jgi:hypothetical protein